MAYPKQYVNIATGLAKLTGYVPGWLFFKPRVALAPGAKRRLPKNCILVSNHRSLLDFPVYLLVFPFRTVRFLTAEVLFNKNKFMSFLLYSLGCIRVDREGKAFGFVSEALEVLDTKQTLGVFPEGRLPVGGKPFPFTVSTAFIATHADSLIVPVYTDGNYGLLKRCNVVIGEAFDLKAYCKEGLSEQQQLEQLTQLLRQKVYDLADEIK
jgi:1-acyl-sn-glycerol-3-phosphate acyltransferase